MFGAHCPTSGSLEKAIYIGDQIGCDVVQLFLSNPQRWHHRHLSKDIIARFHNALASTRIRMAIAHTIYLVNLASARLDVRIKSERTVLRELKMCAQLRIPYLVLHIGSHGGDGIEVGIKRVARALQELTSANLGAMLLIENSAGRGNELGYRLEHIAKLLDDIGDEHLGVCIDLCHAFAAGYDIHSYKGFERFWSDFERIIGISHLRAIHLSDCKGALGMHVDRHESLGKGFIGMRAFKLIARDARFATVPKILETPHHELHATELRILRNLMWNCPIP